MRWMPSTRISLTTKGSNAHAGPVSTSRSAARSAFFTDGSLTREQAVEVVVDGERHQEEEQREAQALAQFHRSLRNRAALENLDDIIEQVSPIQYGNRKQVEHTQADADQREKCDVGADPELRRLTRVIGDRHRSTQVLPGDLADDDLADDRRDIGPVEPHPQTREGIAVEAFEVETRQIQGAPGEPLLGVDHLEPRRLLFHRELQQTPAHLLPARHRLLVYFQDRFAPLKAACLRDGSGIRGADN